MAAQTWDTLKTMLLATLVKAQPPYTVSPPDFDVLFPQATSYAEGRIFHDIPFLGNRQTNASLVTTPGSRAVDTGAINNSAGGPIIVPEQFNLITPAGAQPSSGTRVQFDKCSPQLIDQIWPRESTVQTPSLSSNIPRLWAYRDDQSGSVPNSTQFAPVLIYAPTADGAYSVELSGLFQPTPIGPTNQATYLSTVFPELLEAACMVFLTGALTHNFGSQADDSPMSMSWERLYEQLVSSIRDEEARRRGLMPDTPKPQSAAAR